MKYLKGLDLRNVESRKVFFELLSNVCNIDDDSIDDDEFMSCVSNRIGTRHDNVMKAMKPQKDKARGSRAAKEFRTRQAIYNIWHDFSIVTAYRRYGRDQMKMKEMEFKNKFKDLIVPNNTDLEFFSNKRGQQMVQSTRGIATKTGHQIKAKLEQSGFQLSYGTVLNYKPFYVQKPAEKEKESCLRNFS